MLGAGGAESGKKKDREKKHQTGGRIVGSATQSRAPLPDMSVGQALPCSTSRFSRGVSVCGASSACSVQITGTLLFARAFALFSLLTSCDLSALQTAGVVGHPCDDGRSHSRPARATALGALPACIRPRTRPPAPVWTRPPARDAVLVTGVFCWHLRRGSRPPMDQQTDGVRRLQSTDTVQTAGGGCTNTFLVPPADGCSTPPSAPPSLPALAPAQLLIAANSSAVESEAEDAA